MCLGVFLLENGMSNARDLAKVRVDALKDFETGTFTPTVYGSVTAGTTTYGAQQGQYTKVGNLVTVNIRVSVTSASGSGNLHIGNLPFANGAAFAAAGAVMSYNLDWASGTHLTAYMNTGEDFIRLFASGDNITWSAVPLEGDFEAILSMTYFTS